mgnify:CR=1 FL=1
MDKLNPANRPGKTDADFKRIPMSIPTRRLEAPEIPGYHQYWFLSTADELQRAIDGGYEFVDPAEVRLNSVSLGGNSAVSGNTDMGSRVSVVAGGVGADGQAIRHILMKIRQEWYEEDQKLLEERSAQTARALTAGAIGSEREASGDAQFRYVDKTRLKIPDLFVPKHKR